MKANDIRPDYFSTFFMFPFGFDLDGKKVSALFEESSKWNPQDYEIKNGIDYNEYVYFYKQVRDVLLQMNQGSDKEGVKYFTYNFENHCLRYVVTTSDNKTIDLPIDEISIHLFEPGVGILIFEIRNGFNKEDKAYTLSEYLTFLTNGRRVFPPFINPKAVNENGTFKCGFAGGDSISLGECAERLELKCDKDEIVSENYKINFKLTEGEGKQIQPYLSTVIRHFLDIDDEFDYLKGSYWPIIDDRMFCHSYFSIPGDPKSSNTIFLKKLKIALDDQAPKQYTDDALKIWYQLLFLDRTGLSCSNRQFMLEQIKESSYNRWTGVGTFYGFTRYSSTMVSVYNDYTEFLYNHYRTMYYQMTVLAFFYRGALLAFSKKSAEIATLIQGDKKANERKKSTDAQDKLQQLTKDFLLFRNKLWFREVTAQEQGIEMYDLLTRKMRNVELFQDLQSEIRELYAFFDAMQEKETAKAMNTLTFLGFIFMPLVIATAIFGMNFPLNLHALLSNCESIEKFGISTGILIFTSIVLGIIFWLVGRYFSRKNISDFFRTNK